MARNGGGDSLVATLKPRELGKLDQIGGPAYLSELQDAVPSAENLEFYLSDLRAYFQRRQVIDVIAIDPTYNKRLTTGEWKDVTAEEHGVSDTRFFALKKDLVKAGKV